MKKGNSISRGEVTETLQKHEQDMSGEAENLDVIANDVETVRGTLESLDGDGTQEGVDAVNDAIEQAEDVTVEVFEKEDEQLDEIQGQSEGYQEGLRGRSETAESDLGRISDASGQLETAESVEKLEDAKTAAKEDVDFLNEQIDQAKEALDESEKIQNELEGRIASKGR